MLQHCFIELFFIYLDIEKILYPYPFFSLYRTVYFTWLILKYVFHHKFGFNIKILNNFSFINVYSTLQKKCTYVTNVDNYLIYFII